MNTDENTLMSLDPVAKSLRTFAQNILVVAFGLLPVFFIPTTAVSFEYAKILLIGVGVIVSLVLYSLSVLRENPIRVRVSYPLVALWGLFLVTLISSVFSGDFMDSFIGDQLSVHSSVFVGILALIASIWMLIDAKKSTVMRLYILFSVSTILLVAFHIIRIIFGSDTFTLGIFSNPVSTPVGGWNDLGLFLGLSVILSLIALDHLSLTRVGKVLFGGVIFLSLLMLSVINFFTIWLVLGITSLAIVVYSLTKRQRYDVQLPGLSHSVDTTPLILSLVVFTTSVVFIIGGTSLGGSISKMTNISYVEVRPSVEATVDIARQVYSENALLGIGTNRFNDAWRQYKNPVINTTVFWNTDFVAGNGYVTTFFVTTGILGGIAWIVFLLSFVISGVRMLMYASDSDRLWYFIGVSSFVSALYIWGMSIVYIPGPVMLMLGALCTGITLATYRLLSVQSSAPTFEISTSRRTGFIVTLAVVLIITSSVGALYFIGRHFTASYVYNKSLTLIQSSANANEISASLLRAYSLYPSDEYVRKVGEVQLMQLSALLDIKERSEEEQNQLAILFQSGLNAARNAKELDPSEPKNWALMGGFYNAVIASGEEAAFDRGVEALTKSLELNPRNPLPFLERGIFTARAGKYEDARKDIEAALALKPNSTDALFYLSQIDITTGNVEGAISSTRSIISLEPQNPARYYQLGLLETSRKNIDAAIVALETAISLDTNYANARFLLAFAYDAKGQYADAKVQLEKVLELNPGNQEVTDLLHVLAERGSLSSLQTVSEQNLVEETDNTTQDSNGTVSTESAPETSLVSPVNTAPQSAESNPENVN